MIWTSPQVAANRTRKLFAKQWKEPGYTTVKTAFST